MTDKRVGDAVFGIAPGCLGTSVIVPADLMVHLPPQLGFEAGATAPTVYCTVHAAFAADLPTMAGKKVSSVCQTETLKTSKWQLVVHMRSFGAAGGGTKHESNTQDACMKSRVFSGFPLSHLPQVLVHAGTGGVGLAAVQVCQAMGSQVSATAGSAAKRAFLRGMGVATAGSRETAFVDIVGCGARGDGPPCGFVSIITEMARSLPCLLSQGFEASVPCSKALPSCESSPSVNTRGCQL